MSEKAEETIKTEKESKRHKKGRSQKKSGKSHNIDWTSKLIDLLIVIIGITIAFQLNTWSEDNRSDRLEQEYIKCFFDECNQNKVSLENALDFARSTREDIDTLRHILVSGRYDDDRIMSLTGSMMAIADFSPSVTTMENIIASGEFELIKDNDLRRELVNTYNAYEVTAKLEGLMADYVNEYVTPYFMENYRFSDFSMVDPESVSDIQLENLILGYEAMIIQQVGGYERNLDKQNLLHDRLQRAMNHSN